jgi:aryl-alcohol dehydrogenase-like predicted oxidoreductase
MIRAVEGGLARMRTDYIDLLWVHFPDTVTPTEEIVRGLDSVVRAGKIRYAGLSNFPAWRVPRAATLAELRGWSPVTAVQLEYSLAERSGDRELLPMAETLGLGVALWSPLGGGLLTGKYRVSSEGRLTDLGRVIRTEDNEHRAAAVDAVLDVAAEIGASPAQVAMAWLRARADGATTAYVPIIGPRTVAQLEDYLGALSLRLDPDHERRLTEASAVPLGEPHEQIGKQRATLLGGDADVFHTPIVPVA